MDELELSEAESIAIDTLSVLFYIGDVEKEYMFYITEVEGGVAYDVVYYVAAKEGATSDDSIVGTISIARDRSHGILFIMYPVVIIVPVSLISLDG